MNSLLSPLLLLLLLLHLLCSCSEIQADTNLNETTVSPTSDNYTTPSASFTQTAASRSEAADLTSAKMLTTVSRLLTTSPATVAPHWGAFVKDCLVLYMVSGGLILLSTVLLVSCLMLTWRVRQLKRHLKMLDGHADLISNSEYWMGTARRNKGRSEQEAGEAGVLLAAFSEAREVTGGGANKGEEEEEEEEGKKKAVVGDESEEVKEETPESSSFTKKQEETDPPSDKTVAASSSEGTAEPVGPV